MVGFGQDQSRYYNSEWHFSFSLPKGWEHIPVDELPSKERKTLDKGFMSKTLAVCQKIDAEYFTTPYILVQIRSSEELSEAFIEKIFTEHGERTKKALEINTSNLQKGEGLSMLKHWKGAKRVKTKFEYDKNKHISFEMAELYHGNLGKLIAVTVKLLGSHRMASLRCFAEGDDAENLLDLVDEVVVSFAYDKGYGFGETKGVAPGLVRKLFGGSIWSWVWPILGISIFSWLLRRWATN